LEEAAGRKYELYFETTEWVENEFFAYTMTEGDFKSYDERWEIEATPGGCRFAFNDHIEFKGPFGKIIGIFAARNARATGGDILANLKRLAEADAAP
jgi:ribosome-associated toxin RatA of RatAB toxin-antitoxin module